MHSGFSFRVPCGVIIIIKQIYELFYEVVYFIDDKYFRFRHEKTKLMIRREYLLQAEEGNFFIVLRFRTDQKLSNVSIEICTGAKSSRKINSPIINYSASQP